MTCWRGSLRGILLAFGLTGVAHSQAVPPPLPPAGGSPLGLPASTAAAATTAAGAGSAAAPQTLWGFLGISKANCQACKEHLCNSQLGLMLNNMTAPAGALTGGLVPPLCPPVPSADELAKIAAIPPEERGPEAVAALIKADEAAAKARVAAVEYLGTLDCTYWPEATEVLINSLRADRNECVRFAAARVLSSGCCCSKQIIEALTISMQGTDKDGNPAEKSSRVRSAAQVALSLCVARYQAPLELEEVEPEAVPPELPESTPEQPDQASPEGATGEKMTQATQDTEVGQIAYYRKITRTKPSSQVLTEARQALQAASRRPPVGLSTGRRSVYHALIQAKGDSVGAAPAPVAGPAAGYTAAKAARPTVPTAVPSYDPGIARTVAPQSNEKRTSRSNGRSLFSILSDSRR